MYDIVEQCRGTLKQQTDAIDTPYEEMYCCSNMGNISWGIETEGRGIPNYTELYDKIQTLKLKKRSYHYFSKC